MSHPGENAVLKSSVSSDRRRGLVPCGVGRWSSRQRFTVGSALPRLVCASISRATGRLVSVALFIRPPAFFCRRGPWRSTDRWICCCPLRSFSLTLLLGFCADLRGFGEPRWPSLIGTRSSSRSTYGSSFTPSALYRRESIRSGARGPVSTRPTCRFNRKPALVTTGAAAGSSHAPPAKLRSGAWHLLRCHQL